MIGIKKEQDKKLLQELELAVAQEKKLTLKVLELLQQVENKKLYADLGHRSLFSYCVDQLGYSPAEASVRVNATRLVMSVPSVKKDIDQGSIGLTQASQIQTLFKKESFTPTEKSEIIGKLQKKSTRQTEKILADFSTHKARQKTLTLQQRLLEKIEQVQADMGGISELEVIESLVDTYLQEKKRLKKETKAKHMGEKIKKAEKEVAKTKPTKEYKNMRYLPRTIKEQVDARAQGQCEFVTASGVRCKCRTKLQYDHVRPIGMGGRSTTDNLRKLCPTHNQRVAIKVYGTEFMQAKMRGHGRSHLYT